MIAAANLPADPEFDPDGLMAKPGFKVMHMQDIDYRSTCQPFIACLEQVRKWSHAHPKHIPIFILVETKEEKPRPPAQVTMPESFTSSTFDASRCGDSLCLSGEGIDHARRCSREV